MATEGFSKTDSNRRSSFDEINRRQDELRERIDRDVPLEAAYTLFGSALGVDATPHESGGNRFYTSPISASGDRTPSLHVDENTRRWFDHSNPESDKRKKSGYGVVSLAYYMGAGTRYSKTEILNMLGRYIGEAYVFNPNVVHDASPARPRQGDGVEAVGSAHRLEDSIKDSANVRWFEERGIPEELLRTYCKAYVETVRYSDGRSREYESVAFPMASGGYVLRSASGMKRNMKGFPGDVTLVGPDGLTHPLSEGAGSRRLAVFEGFSDFLSYVMWMNKPAVLKDGNIDFNPPCDCVILNSTSNLSKISGILKRYDDVLVYNDNDDAGKGMAAGLALERAQQRGVPFTLTDEELDFVRDRVLNAVARAEQEAGAEILAGKEAGHVLTKAEAKEVEDAARRAVAHFNLGGRTAPLDRMALQSFADSLTPGNFASLCSRHNLTPYRNTIILRRISGRKGADGLSVRSDWSRRCGVESVALRLYPYDNDLNDRWKKIWTNGMHEAWNRLSKKTNVKIDENMENTEKNPNVIPFEPAGSVSDELVGQFRKMPMNIWKQYQDELIGARDEHRLKGEREKPELWYRRNREIFIDECKKHYGPSPLSTMLRGGYTAVPVRCKTKYIPDGFYIVNFDLRDKSQPNWYTYPIPVKSEDRKVNDGEGNFLYMEKIPTGYVKRTPSEPLLYAGGRNGHFFSDEIAAELRSVGRYSQPVDPVTLEPFCEHTGMDGREYSLNENGDLVSDGKVVCEKSKGVLLSVSEFDPNLVMGLGTKEIGQYLERIPYFETEGQRHVFSELDRKTLAGGGDVSIRIDDRDVTVHYDVRANQVIAGESYEQVRMQERVQKNNELLMNKSLGTGEGEYPKKGI